MRNRKENLPGLSSRLSRRLATAWLATAIGLTSMSAAAEPFRLVYTGTLYAGKDALAPVGGANLVTADTGFTLDALFDTSSPNLSGLPLPGYVAYAPSAATITIGGVSYGLSAYSPSNPDGIAVTLFDRSNVFAPGLYGVGFFANAPKDGAGVVGDFTSASPDFSVTALKSTVFSGFNGAGYSPTTGCGETHLACSGTEYLALTGPGASSYNLSFSGRDEIGGMSTAILTAVPEPASWALMMGGLALVVAPLRRRPRRGGSSLA